MAWSLSQRQKKKKNAQLHYRKIYPVHLLGYGSHSDTRLLHQRDTLCCEAYKQGHSPG